MPRTASCVQHLKKGTGLDLAALKRMDLLALGSRFLIRIPDNRDTTADWVLSAQNRGMSLHSTSGSADCPAIPHIQGSLAWEWEAEV